MNTIYNFMQLLERAAKSVKICFEHTEFYNTYFAPEAYANWED